MITRSIFFVGFYLFCFSFSFAQVGISTDNSSPDASALLDVKSTDKGILIPRMTTEQREMISNAATGLLVFDTDTESFWFKNNTAWGELNSGISDKVLDADSDTQIQVEENADEDIIRFDIAGSEALRLLKNSNGNLRFETNDNCIFIGHQAGKVNTALNNIYIGHFSGDQNTTGQGNVALGKSAGGSNSIGNHNTYIGYQSGAAAGTGTRNTFVGAETGRDISPSCKQNTYIGYRAGYSCAGNGNVFLGFEAGAVASGNNKLYIDNSDTEYPLIYGDFANNMLFVYGEGTGTDYYAFTVDNEIDPINDRANGIKIIAGQESHTTNSRFLSCVTPGGNEIGTIRQNGNNTVNFDTNSDFRLKTNISPTRYRLSDLMKIKVKDYAFKTELDRTHTGFIAQELYETYPQAVTVGGENPNIDAWGVDYGKLTPLLVQAVQEQQMQIETLKEENAALKAQMARLDELEVMLLELKAVQQGANK